MNTKKTEEALTRLYNKLLELKLTKDEQNSLATFCFLYRVGRVNPLQVVARMSYIAKKHRMTPKRIYELLDEELGKEVK